MMKNITLNSFLFFAIFIALSTSCNNDDPEYYSLDKFSVSLASVEQDGDTPIFILDNGTRLFPYATAIPLTSLDNQDRLILNFTLLDDATDESFDYYAKINDFSKILKKEVFVDYDSTTLDSLGNDPLIVNSQWIAADFLNVDFSFAFNKHIHYINAIAVDTTQQPLTIQILHNNNGDTNGVKHVGVVSFNLKPFQVAESDSVTLQVKHLNWQGQEEITLLKYTY